ncbi:hypothetical protein [Aeromicrobium fastidiosum]|uniref:hypothetical protein n=1 Tax=Aeromicrobium fastidiosum TaxID=52699 RepID=UPI00165F3360|nr:hypothetical protein [Aeromicrobium fastidiosum]MBP2388961.1 hypothetical protein [Aeromicrobium fastidiosum]
MALDPATALVAASGLHLGFQAVVTVVVYPALAEARADDWAAAHAAHSRRIVLLVAPLYLIVAAACLWTLAVGPRTGWTLVALAGHAVAAAVTATSAAPSHGRLGRDGRTDRELTRLLTADRWRLAATVVAFGAALAAWDAPPPVR